MAAYKTPGVYVEEIVKFPPSVAQVETAIPAFIGYTQKATKKEVGDLSGDPTRITSMLEYEAFFGFAQEETAIGVSINDEGVISVTAPPVDEKSPFLMYYFYGNKIARIFDSTIRFIFASRAGEVTALIAAS